MVRGAYDGTKSHREDSTYVREDLDVNGVGAFLVRLRRSREANIPGVSSSGPTTPLMFGRATMIPTEANANGWAPRRDGVTVRATAIADARPARRIGPQQAAPYAITLSFWDFLLVTGSVGIARVADSFSAPAFGVAEAGRFVDNARAVGIDIDAEPLGSGGVVDGTYYVPIYGEVSRRVIGFGKVTVGLGSITRQPPEIAPNASAIATSPVPAEVLTANTLLKSDGAILAPALVR